MADPFTLAAIGLAAVAAIFNFTGPILPRLWRSLRRLYGSVCRSECVLSGFPFTPVKSKQ